MIYIISNGHGNSEVWRLGGVVKVGDLSYWCIGVAFRIFISKTPVSSGGRNSYDESCNSFK